MNKIFKNIKKFLLIVTVFSDVTSKIAFTAYIHFCVIQKITIQKIKTLLHLCKLHFYVIHF